MPREKRPQLIVVYSGRSCALFQGYHAERVLETRVPTRDCVLDPHRGHGANQGLRTVFHIETRVPVRDYVLHTGVDEGDTEFP